MSFGGSSTLTTGFSAAAGFSFFLSQSASTTLGCSCGIALYNQRASINGHPEIFKTPVRFGKLEISEAKKSDRVFNTSDSLVDDDDFPSLLPELLDLCVITTSCSPMAFEAHWAVSLSEQRKIIMVEKVLVMDLASCVP